MTRQRAVITLAVLLGAAILTLVVGATLLFKAFRIPTASMEPTMEVGDRIVVRRGGYTPERGDVVVSHPPANEYAPECGVPGFDPVVRRQACPRPVGERSEENFVHRIVALEGDRLRIEGGRAFVDGRALDESYARLDSACELCNLPREITVPDGHVFVMGDNRGASVDSRFWGPIPEDWVLGKVAFRYWPPSRIGGV